MSTDNEIDEQIRHLGDGHMLYKVVGKCPSSTLRSVEGARKVEQDNGTDANRVTLKVKALGCEHIAECRRIIADLRETFGRYSQPWDDNGFRLVPNSKVAELDEAIEKAKVSGEESWKKFLDNLETSIEEDKIKLGKLGESIKFPTRERIANKFQIDSVTMPVPDPNLDARSGWSDDQVERFKNKVREQFQGQVKRAVDDLVDNIHGVVTSTLERLEGNFRATILDNLRGLANSIRDLNVTNDPEIEKIHSRLVDMMKYSPEELRTDETKLKEVVETGREITELRLPKVGSTVIIND